MKTSTTLQKLAAIRGELQNHQGHDPDLWRGFDTITRMLRNVPNDQLAQRFRDIVLSFVWLRRPSTDIEPIENGHFSTMWWLRMLVQTEAELERRVLADIDVPDVPTAEAQSYSTDALMNAAAFQDERRQFFNALHAA